MKILHLITSLKIGGAESALVNFLRAANNKPHEHLVAYFHPGPNAQKLMELAVPIHHITGIVSYADPLALWRLVCLIKQTQPDLIHSALWSANIIGRLLAKYFGLPIICDVHGNSFNEGKFRNWFDRATVTYATKIVAVSASMHNAYSRNILAHKNNSEHLDNLITINNGINCQTLRLQAQQHVHKRSEFGLKDDDFVVGAIGRLEPIKSYNVLLNAFAQCLYPSSGPLKLLIVGGGSQEQTLKRLSADLGIDDYVVFTGYRTDAMSFYPLFNCFVLSSQSEGLSIALLEAMCFGLPIITTNQTMHHDVIKHLVHGLIVPPNNAQSLAMALKSLFENKEQQKTMQYANKLLVEHEFSLSNVVDAYHETYHNVVKNFSHQNKAHL